MNELIGFIFTNGDIDVLSYTIPYYRKMGMDKIILCIEGEYNDKIEMFKYIYQPKIEPFFYKGKTDDAIKEVYRKYYSINNYYIILNCNEFIYLKDENKVFKDYVIEKGYDTIRKETYSMLLTDNMKVNPNKLLHEQTEFVRYPINPLNINNFMFSTIRIYDLIYISGCNYGQFYYNGEEPLIEGDNDENIFKFKIEYIKNNGDFYTYKNTLSTFIKDSMDIKKIL